MSDGGRIPGREDRREAGAFGVRGARAALLAGILLLSAGCADQGGHAPFPEEGGASTAVAVVEVGKDSRARTAEAIGTVRSRTIARVASQVMGRIVSLPVSEGSTVEKGALLAAIDDTQARAQLAAAEASLAEAEAGLGEAERAVAQAEARRAVAGKTYERFRTLLEERVATRQEFDEVEAAKTVADAEYERALDRRSQAAAKIRRARAQADAARVALSHTRIVAPFPGVVTEKQAEAGSMAVPGAPLLVLEDTRRYRIEAAVPETYLGTLRAGTGVRVVLDTAPDRELPATVAEIVPSVDPASRTFLVKVDLPRGVSLRTGMSGRILFPAGEEEVLVVPKAAIVHIGGSDGLFTVTPDNVARLVMIRTGRSFGDDVEVLSGLDPGALVAVSPVDRLADGMRVEIRK